MPQAIAIIGTVVGAGATIKASSDGRKAARAQARAETVKATASRRKAIREARIARAQAESFAQASGAAGGSGITGGVGSLLSNTYSNIGTSSQLSGLNQEVTKYQTRANTASSIAGLGFTVSNWAGGVDLGGNKQKPIPDLTR